jgi:hypothetical protein
VDIYTVQKLGRWKTISMVMRYAHHHPESLRAGVEILDHVPAGGSTLLAQSTTYQAAETGTNPSQAVERNIEVVGCGGSIRSRFNPSVTIALTA